MQESQLRCIREHRRLQAGMMHKHVVSRQECAEEDEVCDCRETIILWLVRCHVYNGIYIGLQVSQDHLKAM